MPWQRTCWVCLPLYFCTYSLSSHSTLCASCWPTVAAAEEGPCVLVRSHPNSVPALSWANGVDAIVTAVSRPHDLRPKFILTLAHLAWTQPMERRRPRKSMPSLLMCILIRWRFPNFLHPNCCPVICSTTIRTNFWIRRRWLASWPICRPTTSRLRPTWRPI